MALGLTDSRVILAGAGRENGGGELASDCGGIGWKVGVRLFQASRREACCVLPVTSRRGTE